MARGWLRPLKFSIQNSRNNRTNSRANISMFDQQFDVHTETVALLSVVIYLSQIKFQVSRTAVQIYAKYYLLFIVKSTALSQLNGDSSGSGSGDSEASNGNSTLTNSTAGEDDGLTSHENAPKNQKEGIQTHSSVSQMQSNCDNLRHQSLASLSVPNLSIKFTVAILKNFIVFRLPHS